MFQRPNCLAAPITTSRRCRLMSVLAASLTLTLDTDADHRQVLAPESIRAPVVTNGAW